MNIAHFVAATARAYPDREAVRYEGTAYSYAELDMLSARVAAGLRAAGTQRGDRVALFLPNRPEFILAYLGAARIGAIAVSLNQQLKRDEVRHILADSAASLIVTDTLRSAQVPADLPSLKHVVLCGQDGGKADRFAAWLASTRPLEEPVMAEPDDELALLYTSGTTGFPKGVTLTHGNVCFAADEVVRYCDTTAEDRLLLVVPVSHCYGQNLVLNHALRAGATLVLLTGLDPGQLLDTIERERVSMLFGVPAMYASLLDACTDPARLRSVRYCKSGAIGLPEKLAAAWFERFGLRIHQGYGLTESSPLASYNYSPQSLPNSIGRPVAGVEMRVADEDGCEPGLGDPGEILIRGPNVMKGYWRKPQETALAIRDGWLHTGDLGWRDRDGNFYVMDRIKDMVNVSGLKAYPAEVELVLNQFPGVREAAAYGIPDAMAGERVGAMLVLQQGHDPSVQEITAFCRERLAAYKVPEQIQFVTSLPRNPSGKLLRRVLRSGLRLAPRDMPAPDRHHFEDILSGARPWFIEQHRIFDAPVLPVALMIEWALAALQSLTPAATERRVLTDIAFTRAMLFDGDQSRLVRALVENDGAAGEPEYRIRFLSRPAEDAQAAWQEHGSLLGAPADVAYTGALLVPAQLQQVLQEQVLEVYQQLQRNGCTYGLPLQGLKQLWRHGNRALGRIDVPEAGHDGSGCLLHPLLLDACLHTTAAFFDPRERQADSAMLPVAIKRLTVHARLPASVWSYVSWHGEQGDGSYLADLELISASGEVLVSIQGLRLARIARSAILAAAPAGNAALPSSSAAQLVALPEADAAQLILHGMRKIFGAVLHLDLSGALGDDGRLAAMPMSSLGADSLRAMELRNTVYAWVGVQLPVQLFISRSRVAEAVDCIYEGILLGSLSQRGLGADADPAAPADSEFEMVML